jgi:hypothetical protein
MIVIPELGSDEHMLPMNRPRLKHLLHRIADRLFIAIALRAIEVTKPDFQCGPGCLFGRKEIRNQSTKPEGMNCTRSFGEGDFCIAKSVQRRHACTPAF